MYNATSIPAMAANSQPESIENGVAAGLALWDGNDPNEAGGWASALRDGATSDEAIRSALLGLVMMAADRLRRALASTRELVGDVARLREEAAAARAWSRALADWRRHQNAVAAADRAEARAFGGGRARPNREKSGDVEAKPPRPIVAEASRSAPAISTTPKPESPTTPEPVVKPVGPSAPTVPPRSVRPAAPNDRRSRRHGSRPSSVVGLPREWLDPDRSPNWPMNPIGLKTTPRPGASLPVGAGVSGG